MTLIPWRNKHRDSEMERVEPERAVRTFRSEMDRLFDRFFDDFDAPWRGLLSAQGQAPAIDVEESDREVTIRAEIPGVDPGDVDVTVSGNILTISGEKKESSEQTRGNVYRSERRFGKFVRKIELPTTVDTEKVTAEHANGVLTVKLQRSVSAAPKPIVVKPAVR